MQKLKERNKSNNMATEWNKITKIKATAGNVHDVQMRIIKKKYNLVCMQKCYRHFVSKAGISIST